MNITKTIVRALSNVPFFTGDNSTYCHAFPIQGQIATRSVEVQKWARANSIKTIEDLFYRLYCMDKAKIPPQGENNAISRYGNYIHRIFRDQDAFFFLGNQLPKSVEELKELILGRLDEFLKKTVAPDDVSQLDEWLNDLKTGDNLSDIRNEISKVTGNDGINARLVSELFSEYRVNPSKSETPVSPETPPLEEKAESPKEPLRNSDLPQGENFIILYGPPGTGKTRKAKRLANNVLGLPEDWGKKRFEYETRFKENVFIVQFHPGYSYEDFIEGIRPVSAPDGTVKYEVICGPFMIQYIKARNDYFRVPGSLETSTGTFWALPQVASHYGLSAESAVEAKFSDGKSFTGTIEFSGVPTSECRYTHLKIRDQSLANQSFVLIVDEINRGRVSQVFGELLFAIADRDDPDMKVGVRTQYSGTEISLPPNLHVVGTMNNTDKSVDDLDQALRRRFSFYPMYPDYRLIRGIVDEIWKPLFGNGTSLEDWLKGLNGLLVQRLKTPDFQIGHSYFLKIVRGLSGDDAQRRRTCARRLLDVMCKEILPVVLSILHNDQDDFKEIAEALSIQRIFRDEVFGEYVDEIKTLLENPGDEVQEDILKRFGKLVA